MKSSLDNLVDELLSNNENAELRERLNSYQFQLSQDILGERVKQKLTRHDAAKKVGLSFEEYLAFERGLNMGASRQEYVNILNRLSVISISKVSPRTYITQKPESLIASYNDDATTKIIPIPNAVQKEKGGSNNAIKVSWLFNKEYQLQSCASAELYRFSF